MSKNIGIDLGTTFCTIAIIDSVGRPVVVKNPDMQASPNGVLTASCLMLKGNKILVGEPARKVLQHNSDAVGRFKRTMGTNEKYHLGERECEAKDLSTILLTKLREAAEEALGEIGTAVVTVPANFANAARDDTIQAAKNAGLVIEHIVNEPTAAAIYYAHTNGGLKGKYAVYDLGGGTFDISIIEVNGQDIDVITSNGLMKLGGTDFDKILVTLVHKKYKEQTGKDILDNVYTEHEAEMDKISLSKRGKIQANKGDVDGELIYIMRSEFEEVISNLIMQTETLLEVTIEEAKVNISDINEIIMVGGSTRIPIIAESIKKVFKKDPVACERTDEAVALGAALYAMYKGDPEVLSDAQKESIENLNINDCANSFFGYITTIVNSDGEREPKNSIIIKKNEKLPTSNTQSYFTIAENQRKVKCRVTQSKGEETNIKYVNIEQEATLDLPPDRPQGMEIQVTYSYDTNEQMHCGFKDIESGEQIDIIISMAGKDDKDNELDKILID